MDIPKIGLGTYRLNNTYDMVKNAILLGYRHIDTAQLYRNEEDVGKAINELIKENIIKREDIFITTKVSMRNIKKSRIEKSVEDSLKKLNIGYIDLLLLHVPVKNKIVSSWNILENIVSSKIKYIGVSNFNIDHLELLRNNCTVKPYVNQIELSPFYQQIDIVEYCRNNGIRVVAHSSLTKGNKLSHETIQKLSDKYTVTASQILLKWVLYHGYCILPRTSREDHLLENFELGFEIKDEDMVLLDSIKDIYKTHKY